MILDEYAPLEDLAAIAARQGRNNLRAEKVEQGQAGIARLKQVCDDVDPEAPWPAQTPSSFLLLHTTSFERNQ